MSNLDIIILEEEIEGKHKRKMKRKRKNMKVSGASVKKLQRIINKDL